MKRVHIRSSKGFTIAEMLVSAVLIVFVVMIAYNSYLVAKETWLYVYGEGMMQSKGMFIIERMVHGVDTTRKGIQEAQGIITPVVDNFDTQIEFIDQDDPDPANPTISRMFYLSDDNEVRYVDESGNDTYLDVDQEIDNDVQTLTFTRPVGKSDLVVIDMILSRTILGKNISIDLSTSVELRNM